MINFSKPCETTRKFSGLRRSEVFEVRSAETELLHSLPAAQELGAHFGSGLGVESCKGLDFQCVDSV